MVVKKLPLGRKWRGYRTWLGFLFLSGTAASCCQEGIIIYLENVFETVCFVLAGLGSLTEPAVFGGDVTLVLIRREGKGRSENGTCYLVRQSSSHHLPTRDSLSL